MVVEKDISSSDVKEFIKKLNITKVKTSSVKEPKISVPKSQKRKLNAQHLIEEVDESNMIVKKPMKVKNTEYWNDSKSTNNGRVLLKSYESWFTILSADFDTMCSTTGNLPEEILIAIEAYVEKVFAMEAELYASFKADWKNDLLTSGTKKDQINANSSLIQASPIHRLDQLDSLIDSIKKGKLRKGVAEKSSKSSDNFSREQVLSAIEALEKLWTTILLPDRDFIPFEKRPVTEVQSMAQNDPVARNKILIIWYFESQLEQRFKTYVNNLNFCLHDTVEKIRERAIRSILILLSTKPHLDKSDGSLNLLGMMIDKTGDPNRPVASYASHCAASLLFKSATWKEPLIIEAENVIFKLQNKSSSKENSKASFSNAMHYCVCFLNQIVLSKEEHKIAERLMFIYLSLFKVVSNKFDFLAEKSDKSDKQTANNQQEMRILTNILTGIHRAMPYCKSDENAKLMDQIHLFYRIVHTKKINTSIQALMILLEMASVDPSLNDRFYSAFYRKLLEPGLAQSHNLSLLFNLIFKTMKRDKRKQRQSAFKKRLLQLGLTSNPPFTCALLCLLSQFVEKPKVKSKTDNESSVKNSSKKNQNKTFEAAEKIDLNDSDDDEYFEDIDEEGKERNPSEKMSTSKNSASKAAFPEETMSMVSEFSHGGDLVLGQTYKPRAMNPTYAGAEKCPEWDYSLLGKHYHPSVLKFTNDVLNGTLIEYAGDPLVDFSGSKFIERFMGKKVKNVEEKKPASPMAPKTKQFMPGVKQLLTATQGPDLSYMETYNKLCKDLKASSKSTGKVEDNGPQDVEDLDSDDQDFDQFLDALDEEQFKAASGGAEIELYHDEDDEDDLISEDEDLDLDEDEEDENIVNDDSDLENIQSDDDLFL
ncbi:CCAAT/enhancer-binding protein zeta-like [Symsagittifera roscoffensis]|uniref:CCAAT/enhancer-binding protein zeta-like n=1 Tax=Symsagittifera roscoffensis TaxID=84072 RepID=UPI00307C07F0